MSAITVWLDESEIIYDNKSYWIIRQLITKSDGDEFDFLKQLKISHKEAKTWDTLHACEFCKTDKRKWNLLTSWLKAFQKDENVYFHTFIFEKSEEWESNFSTPHDYFANQIFFGLANKMKNSGLYIQTLFKEVDSITAIMDRRSANSGFIFQEEDQNNISIARMNDLEVIYENRIIKTLNHNSSSKNISLRFSFASSRCFDGLQLCDCLTYMVRKKFVSEIQVEESDNKIEFLDLFDRFFLDKNNKSLLDFSDNIQFNHFIDKNTKTIFQKPHN